MAPARAFEVRLHASGFRAGVYVGRLRRILDAIERAWAVIMGYVRIMAAYSPLFTKSVTVLSRGRLIVPCQIPRAATQQLVDRPQLDHSIARPGPPASGQRPNRSRKVPAGNGLGAGTAGSAPIATTCRSSGR